MKFNLNSRELNSDYTKSTSKDVKELAKLKAQYYLDKGKLPKNAKIDNIASDIIDKAKKNGLTSGTTNMNEKYDETYKLYKAVEDVFKSMGFEIEDPGGYRILKFKNSRTSNSSRIWEGNRYHKSVPQEYRVPEFNDIPGVVVAEYVKSYDSPYYELIVNSDKVSEVTESLGKLGYNYGYVGDSENDGDDGLTLISDIRKKSSKLNSKFTLSSIDDISGIPDSLIKKAKIDYPSPEEDKFYNNLPEDANKLVDYVKMNLPKVCQSNGVSCIPLSDVKSVQDLYDLMVEWSSKDFESNLEYALSWAILSAIFESGDYEGEYNNRINNAKLMKSIKLSDLKVMNLRPDTYTKNEIKDITSVMGNDVKEVDLIPEEYFDSDVLGFERLFPILKFIRSKGKSVGKGKTRILSYELFTIPGCDVKFGIFSLNRWTMVTPIFVSDSLEDCDVEIRNANSRVNNSKSDNSLSDYLNSLKAEYKRNPRVMSNRDLRHEIKGKLMDIIMSGDVNAFDITPSFLKIKSQIISNKFMNVKKIMNRLATKGINQADYVDLEDIASLCLDYVSGNPSMKINEILGLNVEFYGELYSDEPVSDEEIEENGLEIIDDLSYIPGEDPTSYEVKGVRFMSNNEYAKEFTMTGKINPSEDYTGALINFGDLFGDGYDTTCYIFKKDFDNFIKGKAVACNTNPEPGSSSLTEVCKLVK